MSKGFFFTIPETRHFSPVFGPLERHQFYQFRHQKPNTNESIAVLLSKRKKEKQPSANHSGLHPNSRLNVK
jgi:hypothetical protein